MDFSEETKAVIDAIIEEKMHEAIKQWLENQQDNKFTGKEI